MKRVIGLDRELKLRWLDMAAGFAEVERDKIALRAKLMDALAADIPAHFVRVKTCTVLIRTWLTVPPDYVSLRDRGFELLKATPPDQRLAIHWGMLLLAYPFFRETVALIGRTVATQEAISRGQISRKIIETWGDRTTVKRSILRVFQSLTEWGVLIANGSDEIFRPASAQKMVNCQSALWLTELTLLARGVETSASVVLQAPENFPFDLDLSLNDLIRSGRFSTFREGTDTLVGLSSQTTHSTTQCEGHSNAVVLSGNRADS